MAPLFFARFFRAIRAGLVWEWSRNGDKSENLRVLRCAMVKQKVSLEVRGNCLWRGTVDMANGVGRSPRWWSEDGVVAVPGEMDGCSPRCRWTSRCASLRRGS